MTGNSKVPNAVLTQVPSTHFKTNKIVQSNNTQQARVSLRIQRKILLHKWGKKVGDFLKYEQ
jgi:hypothetical protein